MKKLVYGVLTSAILLSNASAHEIWIEKDKKMKQMSFLESLQMGKKRELSF